MDTAVSETCSLPQILKYVPLEVFLLKMKYIILLSKSYTKKFKIYTIWAAKETKQKKKCINFPQNSISHQHIQPLRNRSPSTLEKKSIIPPCVLRQKEILCFTYSSVLHFKKPSTNKITILIWKVLVHCLDEIRHFLPVGRAFHRYGDDEAGSG